MISLIPVIVYGGVVKKFSNAFLGKPKRAKGKGTKAKYPSKNRPF